MRTSTKTETPARPESPDQGPTHPYRVERMPLEIIEESNRATKEMLGFPLSSYLKLRVHEATRVYFRGHEYSPSICNMTKVIDYKQFPWVKEPRIKRVHSVIHYPEKEWERFVHNCRVQKTNMSAELIKFMLELCSQYHIWKEVKNKDAGRTTTSNGKAGS